MPKALQEVVTTRQLLQTGKLLTSSYRSLLSQGFSYGSLQSNASLPSSCGLEFFGITGCPWQSFYGYYASAVTAAMISHANMSLNSTDFPDIGVWFNASSGLSFLNDSVGLPRWMGIAYSYGFINTGTPFTLVSATSTELSDIMTQMVNGTLLAANHTWALTEARLIAAGSIVRAAAMFLSDKWFNAYPTVSFDLVLEECVSGPDLVPCSPTGAPCIWQLGRLIDAPYNTSLMSSLLSISAKISGSANNIYLDRNAARYFNVFSHCSNQINRTQSSCSSINHTLGDATLVQPSYLWGEANGISVPDQSTLISLFLSQNSTTQTEYVQLACSLASSMFGTYVSSTDFHNDYVAKYINANKEPALTHTFSAENMTELAWAQFGSGAITQAVIGVRSTAQIVNNGMWYMNSPYSSNMIELSSW